MSDYHNVVGLILIAFFFISLLLVRSKVHKIDEGNKDIYGDEFVSLDDDRGGK